MDPDTGSHHQRLTSGQDTWSARCGENRTSGAAGGPGKPTESNLGRAPRSDPATEPSFEDMTIKLRRVIIAARFRPPALYQASSEETRAVLLAWAAAET